MILVNVVLRRKPQSTFCVSVRPWLHSDIHIWVPSFWNLRILENKVQGPSGTLLKEQGFSNLVWNMGHKGPVLRPRCTGHGNTIFQLNSGTLIRRVDRFYSAQNCKQGRIYFISVINHDNPKKLREFLT
jgi:hypothetical protein